MTDNGSFTPPSPEDTPPEREARMTAEAERAAVRRALTGEESDRAPERQGRVRRILPAALLLTGVAVWLGFPSERFPGRLRTHGELFDDGGAGPMRGVLAEARRLHAAGRTSAARELLAPCFRTLAESGTREEIESANAVLEQYWQWSGTDAPRMELEARRILGRAPDSLAANLRLAEALLPFRTLGELDRVPVRELRARRGDFQEVVLRLSPLADSAALPEAVRSRTLLLLAQAHSALWAAAGYRVSPGDPGFEDRERALELCRKRPDDLVLARWRRDMLRAIRRRPWYFWDTQFVEGAELHYRDLDRRIDELNRRIRSSQ